MALEFNKLMTQVERMGAMIRAVDFDMGARLEEVLAWWSAAGDLDKA